MTRDSNTSIEAGLKSRVDLFDIDLTDIVSVFEGHRADRAPEIAVLIQLHEDPVPLNLLRD